MKKTTWIVSAVLLGAILAPAFLRVLPVQAADTAQVASEVAKMSGVVATLTSVEVQKRVIFDGVANQLQTITVEAQGLSAMPTKTAADRAALSTRIIDLSGRISRLTPVVGALIEVRNLEVLLLNGVVQKLITLKSQLI